MDVLEKALKALGYKHIKPNETITIPEETGFANIDKIYPNIKTMQNTIKDLGFNEETLIRIVSKGSSYKVTIHTKNITDTF